jgi:hypothetical protein
MMNQRFEVDFEIEYHESVLTQPFDVNSADHVRLMDRRFEVDFEIEYREALPILQIFQIRLHVEWMVIGFPKPVSLAEEPYHTEVDSQ